jgi:hypothetical protein
VMIKRIVILVGKAGGRHRTLDCAGWKAGCSAKIALSPLAAGRLLQIQHAKRRRGQVLVAGLVVDQRPHAGTKVLVGFCKRMRRGPPRICRCKQAERRRVCKVRWEWSVTRTV